MAPINPVPDILTGPITDDADRAEDILHEIRRVIAKHGCFLMRPGVAQPQEMVLYAVADPAAVIAYVHDISPFAVSLRSQPSDHAGEVLSDIQSIMKKHGCVLRMAPPGKVREVILCKVTDPAMETARVIAGVESIWPSAVKWRNIKRKGLSNE